MKNKNGQKGENAEKRKSADIKADLLRGVIKPVQIRSSLSWQVSFGLIFLNALTFYYWEQWDVGERLTYMMVYVM